MITLVAVRVSAVYEVIRKVGHRNPPGGRFWVRVRRMNCFTARAPQDMIYRLAYEALK